MLRVTSIDEVLSHAARKSRSKPGILGGLAYWIALTRRVVGRRSLGGARYLAPGREMTGQGTLTANGELTERCATPRAPIAPSHFHVYFSYFLAAYRQAIPSPHWRGEIW